MRSYTLVAKARAVLAVIGLGLCASAVLGDREVLGPRGTVVPPSAIRFEYAFRSASSDTNVGWLAFGMPQEDLGVEIEAVQTCRDGVRRTSVGAQYSLTGNLLIDTPAPVLSVGVRDILRSGDEGRAFYVVATKTVPIGLGIPLMTGMTINAGYGSGGMGGGFVGVDAAFSPGITASVEYLDRRVNALVAWSPVRIAQIRAYSLDGSLYYGAVITLRR